MCGTSFTCGTMRATSNQCPSSSSRRNTGSIPRQSGAFTTCYRSAVSWMSCTTCGPSQPAWSSSQGAAKSSLHLDHLICSTHRVPRLAHVTSTDHCKLRLHTFALAPTQHRIPALYLCIQRAHHWLPPLPGKPCISVSNAPARSTLLLHARRCCCFATGCMPQSMCRK